MFGRAIKNLAWLCQWQREETMLMGVYSFHRAVGTVEERQKAKAVYIRDDCVLWE